MNDKENKGQDEKDVTAIKKEIRQTRAEMDGTIDAIHGKLNPTVLKEQAIEQFREAKETVKQEVVEDFSKIKDRIREEVKQQFDDAKLRLQDEYHEAKSAVREATVGKVGHMLESASDTVKGAGTSVWSAVRENPVPAVLTGAGLVWLILSARRSNGTSQRYAPYYGRSRSSYYGSEEESSVLERGRDALGQAAQTVRDKTSDVTGKVAETAGEVRERVQDLAEGAASQARWVGQRFTRAVDENPVIMGAALLACGMAAGLALPKSRREDAWMGQARDQLVEKVEETAHAALGQAQKVAESALDMKH